MEAMAAKVVEILLCAAIEESGQLYKAFSGRKDGRETFARFALPSHEMQLPCSPNFSSLRRIVSSTACIRDQRPGQPPTRSESSLHNSSSFSTRVHMNSQLLLSPFNFFLSLFSCKHQQFLYPRQEGHILTCFQVHGPCFYVSVWPQTA